MVGLYIAEWLVGLALGVWTAQKKDSRAAQLPSRPFCSFETSPMGDSKGGVFIGVGKLLCVSVCLLLCFCFFGGGAL